MILVSVLVVDDLEFWREFVSSALEKEASVEIVCKASNGLQAIQMAEKLRPMVVLLDISMPGLNGLEAAGWIRKLSPDTKIIFLSEEFDRDIVEAAINIGAWGYVLKSEAARDLITAIYCVAQGKKFVSRVLLRHGV